MLEREKVCYCAILHQKLGKFNGRFQKKCHRPIMYMFNPRPDLLFRHPQTHLGCTPSPFAPSEVELCNNDKRKVWYVLNLTLPDLTALRHIVAFQGRSCKKCREKCLAYSIPKRRGTPKHVQQDQFENLTWVQVLTLWHYLVNDPGRSCCTPAVTSW